MKKYSFSFIGNEAAPGYTNKITLIGDLTKPGDQLLWSIPSYSKTTKTGDDVSTGTKLNDVEKDGGSWVGHVIVLPDGILNSMLTYYPTSDKRDALQFCGPIDKGTLIDTGKIGLIPIVGGTGKFTGARGESEVRIVSSDEGTLLFVYDLQVAVA